MSEEQKIVATVYIGINKHNLLSQLACLPIHHHVLISNNGLDFTLPREGDTITYSIESTNIFSTLTTTKVAEEGFLKTLLEVLREANTIHKTDNEIVINHLIEETTTTTGQLDEAFTKLKQDLNIKHDIIPLFQKSANIYHVNNKQWSPLRYYQIKKKDLSLPMPEEITSQRKKNAKEEILNINEWRSMKLHAIASKTLREANIVIILISDWISAYLITQNTDFRRRFEKTDAEVIMIFTPEELPSEHENNIFKLLDKNITPEMIFTEMSKFMDVLVTSKNLDRSWLPSLDLTILQEDYDTPKFSIHFFDIVTKLKGINLESLLPKEFIEQELQVKDGKHAENSETKNGIKESVIEKKVIPKESLAKLPKDKLDDDTTNDIVKDESPNTQAPEQEQTKTTKQAKSSEQEKPAEATKQKTKSETTLIIDVDTSEEKSKRKEIEESIDKMIEKYNSDDIQGAEESEKTIIEAIKQDEGLASLTAQSLFNEIIEKDGSKKRAIAESFIRISKARPGIFRQVIAQYLKSKMDEGSDEKRRASSDAMITLSKISPDFAHSILEILISDMMNENKPTVFELHRFEILRIALGDYRLTRKVVKTYLSTLNAYPNRIQDIANALVSFNASIVGIELITEFNMKQVGEIIEKLQSVGVDGDFTTVLLNILDAWKNEDINKVASIAGMILPEKTHHKHERLIIADKVRKIGNIAIETLANSLGIDKSKVETVLAELIMNDELNARMEMIDDRMFVRLNKETKEVEKEEVKKENKESGTNKDKEGTK